jgi:rhamnosyltransferase
MISQYKIAGVVVLYNPDYSVMENILTYKDQVDVLYIVDNSIQKNLILSDELSKLAKIEFLHNETNIGIASALNLAAKEACSNGYDFLLTMDQDSKATEFMIENLLDKNLLEFSAAIVSPKHHNIYYRDFNSKKNIEEVQIIMTSGNLLNLKAYQIVDGYDSNLFIDYVDIDFCLKLILNDFKIYRINSVMMEHKEGNLSALNIFGRTIRIYNHKPMRWYYKIRNYNYIKQKYNKNFPKYFKEERIRIFKDLLKIVLFEKQKIDKYKFILKGYFDYKRRILGKCQYLIH